MAIADDYVLEPMIPLHVHPIDELVLYRSGQVTVISGASVAG